GVYSSGFQPVVVVLLQVYRAKLLEPDVTQLGDEVLPDQHFIALAGCWTLDGVLLQPEFEELFDGHLVGAYIGTLGVLCPNAVNLFLHLSLRGSGDGLTDGLAISIPAQPDDG